MEYKNPPINEVIIGAYFDQPVLPLRAEHIGLFWSKIRADFPNIQQQPEITIPLVGPSFMLQIGEGEPYPMPRFWLSSPDGTILMQIQKNAFILNWRKRLDDYPHFEAVKTLFDRYFEMFSSFIRDELHGVEPQIQVAELTYSNLIEPSPYWADARDIPNVFPSLSVLNLGTSVEAAPDINYQSSYKLEPDLTLNVNVRTGRKTTDARVPVLVFDLRAIGAIGSVDLRGAESWYSSAHHAIGRCFTAITNPDIQENHWGKE